MTDAGIPEDLPAFDVAQFARLIILLCNDRGWSAVRLVTSSAPILFGVFHKDSLPPSGTHDQGQKSHNDGDQCDGTSGPGRKSSAEQTLDS